MDSAQYHRRESKFEISAIPVELTFGRQPVREYTIPLANKKAPRCSRKHGVPFVA